MRPAAAAMVDDLFVIATGVHQGIRKDRHAVEGAVFVDGLGDFDDVGREPARIERDGAEGVAEDVAEEATTIGLVFEIPPIASSNVLFQYDFNKSHGTQCLVATTGIRPINSSSTLKCSHSSLIKFKLVNYSRR